MKNKEFLCVLMAGRSGCTIKRDIGLEQLASKGMIYQAARWRPDLVAACLSAQSIPSILIEDWTLPAGAYGTGEGLL